MSREVGTGGARRRPRAVVVIPRLRRGGAALPRRIDDAPTIMSANKVPDPDGRKHGPLAVRRSPDSPVVVVQEKVLADIRHELGNFFHKLYYWSEYLREKPARNPEDATAAEMLERTIKNLEEFLKVSLEYFRPTQLSCVRMQVPELVDGLLFQLRSQLNGTPVAIRGGDEWREAE